jgi:hypothetical protein
MFEAAFAPVRVPAGRQGGPRTHYAAGQDPTTANRQSSNQQMHNKKHENE